MSMGYLYCRRCQLIATRYDWLSLAGCCYRLRCYQGHRWPVGIEYQRTRRTIATITLPGVVVGTGDAADTRFITYAAIVMAIGVITITLVAVPLFMLRCWLLVTNRRHEEFGFIVCQQRMALSSLRR